MTSQLQLSFANAQVAGTANSTLDVGGIQLQICGSPNYYKTDGATPPGGYGANFTWTHTSNDCWVGVNNVAIAASTGGTITLSYAGTQITPDPQETTANIGELTPACCSNTSAPIGLSASFAVVSPILSSSFSPTTIASRGVTTLTFTLLAANLAPANAISFADNLPAGLVVAPIANIGGTCSNAAAATTATAGGSTIAVSNVAVPAGPASCTVTVDVTNAAGRTNASCTANPPAFTHGPGNYVKVAKVQGTIGWHSHESEDELFVALKGCLRIDMEAGPVVLNEGDLFVVAAGTRHNPSAPDECLIMLIERKSTLHKHPIYVPWSESSSAHFAAATNCRTRQQWRRGRRKRAPTGIVRCLAALL